jgi:hypothetical protein
MNEMPGVGHVAHMPKGNEIVGTEEHTADSKWQFCGCKSCRGYRTLIDSQPGTPINYATYRKKDERY